jgi:dTDP-4-amino-4,6-dideoxygalactose transaminase
MNKIPLVDLKSQYLTIKEDIYAAIDDCLENTAFIQGARVKKFESEFAEFLGVKHAIGCANGTDAIFLALKALDVGPGDEVITAANSFIATSEAITMTGAKAVFADVDEKTANITPETIEKYITEKTKVILPVHLAGYPADLPALRRLADFRKLSIVGDGAQAHGAKIDGRPITDFADITTYSFYPGKNLGAFGDAGATATNDGALADKISMLRNHGRKDKYLHEFEGYNMRMDEIQAAVLSVKLKKLHEWTEARRRLAALYNEELKSVGDIEIPYDSENAYAVFHLYVIETGKRDELMGFLKERNIGAGIHYPIPLPLQPAYSYLGLGKEDIPVVFRKSQRIISLPLYPEMTEEQQSYIISTVKEFYKNVQE